MTEELEDLREELKRLRDENERLHQRVRDCGCTIREMAKLNADVSRFVDSIRNALREYQG